MSNHPANPTRLSRLWASFRVAVLVVLSAAFITPAMAQGRPPPRRPATTAQQQAPVANKVGVQLMVVRATNAHQRIDADLKDVLQHLRFFNFTGYELLSKQTHDIAVGGDHTYAVEGDRRVKVDVLSRDEKQVKLRVRMFDAKDRKLDTTVSIHRNKSFLIGGPEVGDGVLILPLTARY